MRFISKKVISLLLVLILTLSLCTESFATTTSTAKETNQISLADIDEQPSDVYYELCVRSFYDSDGNGVGDFNGVTSKLDYLKDLGINAIWLMPITESGYYYGYDTVDYYNVESDYGTIADFENMVTEAHKRGIKVIMDLVINHSSSDNPWFQSAIKDSNSPYRDYYKIEQSTNYDEDKDNNATDDAHSGNKRVWQKSSLAPGYRYLGIFGEGVPELNYDNPKVHEEMIKVGQFWLKMGVDGFRLDAARHIYGDYLNTLHSDEIMGKNVDWWKEFRAGCEKVNKDAYLVGEVWEENYDYVKPYIQEGALQSTFDFGLATQLLNTAKSEKDSGFVADLCEKFDAFGTASDNEFTDCTFLTNHDLNRTMSQLDGNYDHAKTAAALLLTLPGNPFIYYGEEVGLQDMEPWYGLEPMPWYESNQGSGLTNWPWYESNQGSGLTSGKTSVEYEEKDSGSVLSRYKELINWRKEIRPLKDGDIAQYDLSDAHIASYVRMTEDGESVLVATNLTGQTDQVTLPTADYNRILKKFSADSQSSLKNDILTIAPYSTLILTKQASSNNSGSHPSSGSNSATVITTPTATFVSDTTTDFNVNGA